MSEKDVKISAKLFGDFVISYFAGGGVKRDLTFGRSRNSKTLRLLQILIAHHEQGISRNKLIECFFMDSEISDVANSLRVSMHRLRRQLVDGGLPSTEFFLYKDGIYKWNPELPLETDFQQFLKYIDMSEQVDDDVMKSQYLYKACSLYRGEFLTEIGAEEWVVVSAVKYKMIYEKAVRKLLPLLRKSKSYDRMLEISSTASKIYPYDEWQVEQIESLVAMERISEAISVYKQALHRYNDELQIQMPERMVSSIRKLSSDINNSPEILNDIRGKLEEPVREGGAIYLSPPSFIDTFRLLVRIAERNEQPMCLMVCAIKTERGSNLSDRERLNESADILQEAIKESLRRGDCFTHYTESQFLILLVGTEVERCEMIFHRINARFRKNRRLWSGNLDYYVTSVDAIGSDAAKIKIRNNKFQIDKSI